MKKEYFLSKNVKREYPKKQDRHKIVMINHKCVRSIWHILKNDIVVNMYRSIYIHFSYLKKKNYDYV